MTNSKKAKRRARLAKEAIRRNKNKSKAKKYARMLKCRITKAERMLKEVLDEDGIVYDFQKPFYDHDACYIVDFYFESISGKKYIIEIDGKTHNKHTRKYDLRRSMVLYARMGCAVIRFKNEEVFNDLGSVIQRIYDLVPRCIDDKFRQ